MYIESWHKFINFLPNYLPCKPFPLTTFRANLQPSITIRANIPHPELPTNRVNVFPQ
jgi:hypothetical protein